MRLTDGGRLIAFTVLAAAMRRPAFAAKLTDKEHTRIDEPRPADVPSDAELEAAGAVIGTVEIDTRNIFDESDPRENNGLFRLADRLHVRTKHATIQAQLLFASGDKYLARKLAETERALRLLTYIYDARIVPVRYADGKVDIKVITKDVWTLSPGISFGRSRRHQRHANSICRTRISWGGGRRCRFRAAAPSIAPATPWPGRIRMCLDRGGPRRSPTRIRATARSARCWSRSPSIRWMRRGARKSPHLSFDRTISRYNLGNIVDQFNDNRNALTN